MKIFEYSSCVKPRRSKKNEIVFHFPKNLSCLPFSLKLRLSILDGQSGAGGLDLKLGISLAIYLNIRHTETDVQGL